MQPWDVCGDDADVGAGMRQARRKSGEGRALNPLSAKLNQPWFTRLSSPTTSDRPCAEGPSPTNDQRQPAELSKCPGTLLNDTRHTRSPPVTRTMQPGP